MQTLQMEPTRARALMRLDAVSVQLGPVQALQRVSVRIHAGERVALIGPNGSGKSTLLRTLHGLQAPSAGQVWLEPAQRSAMLFQRPHMLRLSAQSNVALGLWLDRSLGLSWRTAKDQALLALARVGLQGIAQQGARQLSGGQQQRLALARAWARRPDVLLLDEPTASLDPHAKREVEALILAFAQGLELGQTELAAAPPQSTQSHSTQSQNTSAQNTSAQNTPLTLVWASHNLGQVKRIATRVLCLESGRLLADLPVQDFFNAQVLARVSPQAHAFVQGETA